MLNDDELRAAVYAVTGITPEQQLRNEAHARQNREEFDRFEAAMRAAMEQTGIKYPEGL